MNQSLLSLTAALALGLAATSQAASATPVNYGFSGNTPQGSYTAIFSLDVTGGEALSGVGTLTGLGLSGTQDLTLITLATPGATYPGPSVGFRGNDGTDVYGCDTAVPIDASCLVFAIGPNAPAWGQDALFAIWWDPGSNTYQDFFAGHVTADQPNMYFQSTADVSERNVVPAPEPATLALFGVALAGFSAMRRRKKTA